MPDDAPDQPNTLVAKFNPTVAEIQKVKEEYSLLVKNPEAAKTAEGYALVKAALKTLTGMRTDIERHRVNLKAEALAFGRKVDGEAKRLTSMIQETEFPLRKMKEDKDAEDERAARAIVEAEEKRVAAERARLEQLEREKKEAEEAERQRQYSEAQAKLAEERRLLDEERKRRDAEHQAERDRLAAERQKHEAELIEMRRQREEMDRAKREQEARERAEKEKAERAEFERQANERAARQAQEHVERVAQEKAEAERQRAAKEEAERKAAAEAAPDVEKVKAFALHVRGLAFPERVLTFKTAAARRFMEKVLFDLGEIIGRCEAYKGR